MSPAYVKEYREWIRKDGFRELYGRAISALPKSLKQEHPALVALDLSSIANCYYKRGAVAVLDGNQNGWQDIQCGYWASVEKLRFEIKSVTLPAWSAGRNFSSQVELVLTLGLARLFRQDVDASWLSSAIPTHFHPEKALGTKVSHGRLLLESILKPEENFSFLDLLRDRNQCCSKRDAWRSGQRRSFLLEYWISRRCCDFPPRHRFNIPNLWGLTQQKRMRSASA
jgi:hypothetical protein